MMRIGMPATYATAKTDRDQRDRRAEIRLPRDDEERDGGQRAGDQQIAARDRAAAALAEELGEHQRDRRLGELRRLQVERPEVDPAPRSAAHDAEEQHVDEQGEDRRCR